MKSSRIKGMFLVVVWLAFAGIADAADVQKAEDQLTDVQKTVKGITSVFGGGDKTDAAADEPKATSEEEPLDTATTDSSSGNQTIQGLKEALMVGIQTAVERTGTEGGFYQNPDIKILLPEKLQTADKVIRQLGGDELSEALVLKMNQAAEKAAPEAEAIFVDAIKTTTIDDAQRLLNGGDTAATGYLEDKTSASLKESFYPIIKSTMEEIGVIKTYNDYVGKYSSNPLLKVVDLDLNRYVTDESIDGLFLMVAEEEKKIRENPAARVTDLLKSVFGKLGE